MSKRLVFTVHSARHAAVLPSSAIGWNPCSCSSRIVRFQSTSSSGAVASTMEDTFPPNNNNNNSASALHPLYPKLFTPLDLGPVGVLPNRVLMGSMHTGLEGHSLPSWAERLVFGGTSSQHHTLEKMATYFQTRARGGVGLMVTGGISPNIEGWVGPFAAKLTTTHEMEHHKVVTSAVHDVDIPIYGTTTTVKPKICLQILHTGRYAYHPFAVSASATKSPISPFKAKALSKSGINRTIQDFVNTATLAQEAGYDGVELMGSEGYLLSQFLCPRTNVRNDEYGGSSAESSFANRARFPLEMVRAVRAATGPEFLIIFRISLLDLVEDGCSWEETLQLATWLKEAGVTILNTGIGWHEARVPTIATSVPRGAFTFCTQALKDSGVVEGIPLVSTNRINAPDTAESILQLGGSDLVSMARPFLADPRLLQKSMNQQAHLINTCIGCNQACLDHAFVGKTASCLVNPIACHEEELTPYLLPTDQRLKIGVIGTGPAGCAFAVAAAQMGHTVTVYDKANEVGGQFHMAKRIPGKEEFYEALRYFKEQLDDTGVTVKLSTEMSIKDMEVLSNNQTIDKWIVATGVTPRDPNIPGQDHPNVLSYIDVLKHNVKVGNNVAVIGAGGIGFDVSEFLVYHDGHDRHHDDVSIQDFWKEWGVDPKQTSRGGLQRPQPKQPLRNVHLLQRKNGKLGAGLGRTTGWIHRASLKHAHVNMISGVQYDQIDEHGHLHYTIKKDGQHKVLEVDNIIFCAGQVEEKTLEVLASTVDSLKNRVYTIGGAYKAGELDAKRAIDMGHRLAVNIHDPTVTPGNHVLKAPIVTEEKMFQLLRKYT
jgi:2,4-dienoyl-CoA reductase (NADPH2)